MVENEKEWCYDELEMTTGGFQNENSNKNQLVFTEV